MTRFLEKLNKFLDSGEVSDIDFKFPNVDDTNEKRLGVCSKKIRQICSFIDKLMDEIDGLVALLKGMDSKKEKAKCVEYLNRIIILKQEIEISRGLMDSAIVDEISEAASLPEIEIRKGWILVSPLEKSEPECRRGKGLVAIATPNGLSGAGSDSGLN